MFSISFEDVDGNLTYYVTLKVRLLVALGIFLVLVGQASGNLCKVERV